MMCNFLQAIANVLGGAGASTGRRRAGIRGLLLRAQNAVAKAALSTLDFTLVEDRLLEAIGQAQGQAQGHAYGHLFHVLEGESTAVISVSIGEGAERFLGFGQLLSDEHPLTAMAIRRRQPADRRLALM
jgi:hypothetical protein